MVGRVQLGTLVLALGVASAAFGQAESTPAPAQNESWPRELLDSLIKGQPKVDLRARLEVADFDGPLKRAEAVTLRTRLGYGTRPFHGVSAFVEFENIAAANEDAYFDAASTPNGKSPIADPEDTELNRFFLKAAAESLGTTLVLGRQRRIDDDARFVGNVGWRQNEQTFDSVTLETSLGLEDLSFRYSYVWDVHRIFGNHGTAATRDFDSDSHLLLLRWDAHAQAAISAFAYLLDFEDAPSAPLALSTSTFGVRIAGKAPFAERFSVSYALRYAIQVDAGHNPVNYAAHHVAAEAGVGFEGLGSLGVGFELLGSDGGKARFVTPLATAHKFNGWADVFLDNGGKRGLQDFFVQIAPELPVGLRGEVVYHHFESDQGGINLGDEIDAVLSRPIGKHLTPLV